MYLPKYNNAMISFFCDVVGYWGWCEEAIVITMILKISIQVLAW